MSFAKILLITLAAAAVIPATAGDWVKNVRSSTQPLPELNIAYDTGRSEAVIPRLNAPDLKGGSKNWEKAWQGDRFTVTRVQAVNYAHALQGGGEWEQLLPKTLIPRKATQLKMGYDSKKLYLQITCMQPQMEAMLKIPSSGKRDSNVWNHENVDVLLSANRNSNEYFQILCDCIGAVYDARQIRNQNTDAGKWNPDYYKHIYHGKDRWVLTLALPAAEWGLPLEEGKFIDGNICRVEIMNHENSSLSPVNAAFKEADRFCRFWIGRKTLLPEISAMKMVNPMPGKNELLITVKNPGKSVFKGALRSGKKLINVTVGAGRSQVFKFAEDIAKPGKYHCSAALLDKSNTVIDQVAADAVVNPPLQLKLSSREFIAGNAPVTAQIKVNAISPDAVLEISCGKLKKTLKADTQVEFDFTPATDSESADFKVVLLKGKQPVASTGAAISITSDPFAE